MVVIIRKKYKTKQTNKQKTNNVTTICIYICRTIRFFLLADVHWTVSVPILPPRNGIRYGTKYTSLPSK